MWRVRGKMIGGGRAIFGDAGRSVHNSSFVAAINEIKVNDMHKMEKNHEKMHICLLDLSDVTYSTVLCGRTCVC